MADKLTLSREYMFVPMTQMNFDMSDISVNQIAFVDAGVEPAEQDWLAALVVDDQHALFDPDIGESFAILVGPDRGDGVTTEDLDPGDYQVWIDASVTGSDERVVRISGTLTITDTGS